MRKLFYILASALIALISTAGFAQTPSLPITTVNNLKISTPVLGTAHDSVLVWRGTGDKVARYVPASVISVAKNFQQTLLAGNITNLHARFESGLGTNTDVWPGNAEWTTTGGRVATANYDGFVVANSGIDRINDFDADSYNFHQDAFSKILELKAATLTGNHVQTFQNKTGTVALTSDIADAVDNYIPLSGTLTGKPVTGTIEFLDTTTNSVLSTTGTMNIGAYDVLSEDSLKSAYAAFSHSSNLDQVTLRAQDVTNGLEAYLYIKVDRLSGKPSVVVGTNGNNPGLSGDQDFTANITDLDYTQKKYVDDQISAATGGIDTSGIMYNDNRNGNTFEMANNSINGVSSLNVIGIGTFGGAVTASNFSGSSSGTNTGDNAANTNTGLVHTTGAETIAGVKTFSNTIVGSVNGNAATVTTNANLSGDVTSSGNTTTYNNVVPANKGGAGANSGILKANGSGTVTAAVAADFPTLNQNTTGNAATVTTNANLTGPITSSGNATSVAAQTGTGSTFVMQTSPTLTTPNIGTPTAGTLTSCTGLPISTGVSGLATGIATFLGTSSSANLATALTDETGSGAAVFGTSPTIATPTLSGVVTFSTNNFSITGGSTANLLLGTGAAQSGNTFVQGRTIGTDATAGSTAVITSANTVNSAPFQLQNQISSMTAYTAKTTTYTATASDFMIDCTSGTFTVTLPTAVGITGKRYCVKNSGAGTITLATTSSQTIDGVTTKTINVQYSNYQIISDGANWKVISAL